jgi:hypothetical protein
MNAVLDDLTVGLGAVEGDVNRALKLPAGTTDQTLALTAGQRANLTLGFDAAGNVLAFPTGRFRGDWVTGALYFRNEVLRDSITKDIYAVLVQHTSGVLATDIAAARLQLMVNVVEVETAKNAAAASAAQALVTRDETTALRDNAAASEVDAEIAAAFVLAEKPAYLRAAKFNLGNKATPPTRDNQGEALLAGATYYDTALNKWRVWTGSAWGDGISSIAGVASINGQTGDVTLSSVSLSGSTAPLYITQTRVYTITDHSSFATYSASATAGTASITGDQLTYAAPGTAQAVTLTVTRNGAPTTFAITVNPATVQTPVVSVTGSPSSVNETPTVSTGAFAAIGAADTHQSTTWRVRRVSDGVVVFASVADAVNKLSITVPSGNLAVSTAYAFEAIHIGATLGASATGSATANTAATFNSYITTPAATPAAMGDAFEGGFYTGLIWNELVQSATSTVIGTGSKAFTVPSMSGSAIVYEGQQLEVRSRATPANRMQGTVTAANGTTLTINVASVTGSGTFADWSIMSRYRVIVAPKASGENASVTYKNANTAAPTATGTLTEGRKATLAMVAADTATVYPAAHWCNNLSIGSRTDWYLPARDELELCWRNLKPTTTANYTTTDRPTGATPNYANDGSFGDVANTHGLNNNSAPTGAAYTSSVPGQTAATAFRTGGAEAYEFGSSSYWSASEYSATKAWSQNWSTSFPGYQNPTNKTGASRVRAVRRSII